MKKLLIILLVLIFTLPVMAENKWDGTVTESVEYNSLGELTDSTEIAVSTEIDEDIDASFTFTVNDLVSFNPVGLSADGTLTFQIDEGEAVELGTDIDLITYDMGIYAKYTGLAIGDKGILDTMVKGEFPANTFYGISTLTYNVNKDLDLIVEARYDSDGAESFSTEAQAKYIVNEDLDITFGAELNEWDDAIISDIDKVYAKFVFKF